jgi:release factor glutamine methyltransferase
MNIENTLNTAIKTLTQFNIQNANLDSEILLAKIIGKDRNYIILNSKEHLNQKYLFRFNNLIERRKKGEPVAYLTRKKEFWKNNFYINQNVLVPRPDTELIVEEVLKFSKKKFKLQILDIGTGSGCILLSLLKEIPSFYGTGIDISKKSINVSKFNAKMLNLTNRVKFYHSDVDKFKIGKYDIVVSNPPYIELLKLKYLDKDLCKFEPR